MRTTVALLLWLLPSLALAHDPAHPDYDAWYGSLQRQETSGGVTTTYPCCSKTDCRPVDARTAGDHWEAFIDRRSFGDAAPNDWRPVDPATILQHQDNPTGEPVACWFRGQIICFALGNAM